MVISDSPAASGMHYCGIFSIGEQKAQAYEKPIYRQLLRASCLAGLPSARVRYVARSCGFIHCVLFPR